MNEKTQQQRDEESKQRIEERRKHNEDRKAERAEMRKRAKRNRWLLQIDRAFGIR